MPRFPVVSIALLAFAAPSLRAAAPLERVETLRALSPAQIASGLPVQLAGVITYLRDTPADLNFILDDGTGGVMVYPTNRAPLQPGQRVEVEGLTQLNQPFLRILSAQIRPGELAALPSPIPATLADLANGTHEGRFVELTEIVHVVRLESARLRPQRLALDFGPRAGRLTAWISNFEGTESRFTAGARVRLRGVALRWRNDRAQPISSSLLVNAPRDSEVLAGSPQPDPEPLQELLLWGAHATAGTLRATSGTVTHYRPGELLVVQEGDRALRCRPAPPDALPHESPTPRAPMVGDRVEVCGFPVLGEYTVELEDARFRVTGAGAAPEPVAFADARAVLAKSGLTDRDARLIQLPATVTDVRERDGQQAVELRSGDRTFTAWLPPSATLPEGLGTGAEVRVTGICTLQLSAELRRLGQSPAAFSLQLAGPEAIVLLHRPPWWTPHRLLGALVGAVGFATLCALWAGFFANKNARLRAEIAGRQRAEAQLASERRRVAADLHDTLDQTLLAASLQLAAARHTAPMQSEPLNLAQQLVARGQQEVRDAVWDLHMGTGEAAPALSTLLTRATAEAALQTPVELMFSTTGDEPPLPALLSVQAVRLTREAITNSLKHGRPQHVQITLAYTPTELQLTIADDGRGFDPANAAGPETGHFGLTGMRERLQRLGGELQLTSVPNRGTTLGVRIPLPSIS